MKCPAAFFFILLFGCTSLQKEAHPAESYLSFTDDGAWCWFSDPRAIYYKGEHRRTYAGWVDSTGSVIVGFYDHDLKQIETKVIHHHLEKDDHDNPSLFIDKQGKLMVFYAKHARREPIYLAKAKNAEDISEWETVGKLMLNDTLSNTDLSDTYTYATICQLADEQNRLYLFWRGVDFKPNVSVSEDNGATWSTGKILILPERIYNNRRPYLKVATNHKDVIHFAFTDGHPHAEPTNSIYYAKYADGGLHKANGEKIMDWAALPIQPQQADKVYDATITKKKAWIWDVAENKQGAPVIVYSQFPTDSTHFYYYSIWDNDQWNNYELINSGSWFPETPRGEKEREPNYSGGIVLDHEDPAIVYLSRSIDGVFEIEKWSTPDKGKTWQHEAVTKNSQHNNVRPFVIQHHGQDTLQVLWMSLYRYVHWTDYQSAIRMNIRK